METVWGEVVGGEMRQLKEGVRTERSGNYCTAENKQLLKQLLFRKYMQILVISQLSIRIFSYVSVNILKMYTDETNFNCSLSPRLIQYNTNIQVVFHLSSSFVSNVNERL